MKALKSWEKWLLRTIVGRAVRCATSIISGIVFPMSAALLFVWLVTPTKELLSQASDGEWVARILTSQYTILWILFLFALFLPLFIRATIVANKKGYLPEVCIRKAQGILDDNPEFASILNPLIQNAMATDNESGLAGKTNTIHEIIRLKEGLACKRMGVEMLEDQIAKRETELKAKIE